MKNGSKIIALSFILFLSPLNILAKDTDTEKCVVAKGPKITIMHDYGEAGRLPARIQTNDMSLNIGYGHNCEFEFQKNQRFIIGFHINKSEAIQCQYSFPRPILKSTSSVYDDYQENRVFCKIRKI